MVIDMATSAFAWPSILVVKGSKVVLDRTIKKCDWAENFESVFEGLGSDFNSETLSKVLISSNERIVEPAHIVPLDAPIKLLDTYNCHYICYKLEEDAVNVTATSERNVATVLMQNARRLVQPSLITPASPSEKLCGDLSLRNDVVRYLQDMDVGWSPSTVSTTGEKFVKTLAAALWYIDPHHKEFVDR